MKIEIKAILPGMITSIGVTVAYLGRELYKLEIMKMETTTSSDVINGIFVPLVTVGASVVAGQVIGYMYDLTNHNNLLGENPDYNQE
jgi:predicted deacylase